MNASRDGLANNGAAGGAPQVVAAKRRRLWYVLIGANVMALIATIAGCLFITRSQGIKADVEEMRREVGGIMTAMSLGGGNEAIAKYIPRLIGAVSRWDRNFAERSEGFRGMDEEIDKVHAMARLGTLANAWRKELESVSPTQRDSYWQDKLKARVEKEQKKWPYIVHSKSAWEWLCESSEELWRGLLHGVTWPQGIWRRADEAARGVNGTASLDFGETMHYVLFPIPLAALTMSRVAGMAFSTSLIGYLMCWIGLKSRFGWFSYLGLVYFLYLLMAALFIVWLEVS